MKGFQMLRQVGVVAAVAAPLVLVVVSLGVQFESRYAHEELGGAGPARALVLYHPSRDASFTDELSLAMAGGFRDAGLAVERATLTGDTPGEPAGYEVVVVVSNTYYWTPDLPTLRYLHRARLSGTPVIGIMAGAGATARAERILADALAATGAESVTTRSLWLLRPNDEARSDESNREVALDIARSLACAWGADVASPTRHLGVAGVPTHPVKP